MSNRYKSLNLCKPINGQLPTDRLISVYTEGKFMTMRVGELTGIVVICWGCNRFIPLHESMEVNTHLATFIVSEDFINKYSDNVINFAIKSLAYGAVQNFTGDRKVWLCSSCERLSK